MPDRPPLIRFLLATLVAAAACGGGERGSIALSTVRDTVGDTIVVRTLAGSAWGAPRRLVPTLSIGVLEGDDPYMFGGIAGIGVDAEGRIFVLDAQVPALRRFTPDGAFDGDIGRPGEGPGEYEEPDGGPVVLPDGRVVVRDPGSGKLVQFSTEGEPLGDFRLPSGGIFTTSDGLAWDSAGNVLTPTVTNIGADVTEWEWGYIRFAPDGGIDTLRVPDWDFEPWVVTGQGENSSSSRTVPFAPRAITSYSPLGYFVGGPSAEYHIDEVFADGQVLRIERVADPIPVNPDEAAFRRRQLEKAMRDRFPGWDWNGPDIPGVKPAIDGVFMGLDGRLWVKVPTRSEEVMSAAEAAEEERATGEAPNRFAAPLAFDVFEPGGEYLGRVDAPDGMSLTPSPVFRGETVWAVTRDELDVQRVVRFELAPIGSAGS